jgi:hypothetical protein
MKQKFRNKSKTRIVKKFLFLPKTIGNITKWLEFVEYEEVLKSSNYPNYPNDYVYYELDEYTPTKWL